MNYHSIHYGTEEIDEEWLLKSRLAYFTANKLFSRESCLFCRQLNGQHRAKLNTRTALMGHVAEIPHPEATPAPKSLLIVTGSILLSWQETKTREAAGKSEQVVKQSYEQIWGKDARNTEKSRGNVMVGVPDLAEWQGEEGSRSSDKAVCQLPSLLIHHAAFTIS